MTLLDDFGDGWSGTTFNVYQGGAGGLNEVVYESLGVDMKQAEKEVCLAAGCYTVKAEGGNDVKEVSWLLRACASAGCTTQSVSAVPQPPAVSPGLLVQGGAREAMHQLGLFALF